MALNWIGDDGECICADHGADRATCGVSVQVVYPLAPIGSVEQGLDWSSCITERRPNRQSWRYNPTTSLSIWPIDYLIVP